jgi:hypothetical protein
MAMGLASATESYAASAVYTTLASLSGIVWRIRWAKQNRELFPRNREFRRKNREFGLRNPKTSSDEVFGTHSTENHPL